MTTREQNREYVLSKQLLRSGTSIGANIAEAEFGISKDDFKAKMYIALKECNCRKTPGNRNCCHSGLLQSWRGAENEGCT